MNGNDSNLSNPLAAATTFKTAKDGRDKDARIALGANGRFGSKASVGNGLIGGSFLTTKEPHRDTAR